MFGFLRKKPQAAPAPSPSAVKPAPAAPQEQWEEVPNYIDIDPKDEPVVALIAAATTATEAKDCQLRLKRLAVQNPEAQRVAVIAASVAAVTSGKQFVVKTIYRKVSGPDAAQV